MDNEKRQRLEEILVHFQDEILEKMSTSLSDMDRRIQHEFRDIHQRLDRLEQLIRDSK